MDSIVMAKCVFKQRKKTIICTGSLNKSIQFLEKALRPKTAPFEFDISLKNTLTLLFETWAMNEDGDGQEIFDDVGSRIGQRTDVWYVRYDERITSQTFIQHADNFYKIHNVRPIERNTLYLKIESEIRGNILREAARS